MNMTLEGEIYVLMAGLQDLGPKANRANVTGFDISSLLRDVGKLVPVDITMAYATLPIPDDYFFPSGNVFSYEKVEEEWEQDFIEWCKQEYGVGTKLQLGPEKVDLEEKIENPRKFREKFLDLLPSSTVIDGEGSLWPDVYFDRPGSVQGKSKKLCEILTEFPSVRTKAIFHLLQNLQKKISREKVAASYLVKKHGFTKSKFTLSDALSDNYRTVFPVVAEGDIPKEFLEHACKLYVIDAGLGNGLGINIYVKSSRSELEIPTQLLNPLPYFCFNKKEPLIIDPRKAVETLRIVAKYVVVNNEYQDLVYKRYPPAKS